MTRIAEGFDRFGNPIGRAFDLGGGDEHRVQGEKILIYVTYPVRIIHMAVDDLRRTFAERGFQMDIRESPNRYGPCDLDERSLAAYSQLWFLSGDRPSLSPQQVQMIVKYVRAGNGLAIWADNEPLYADANLLTEALMGTRFSGDKPADGVMVPGPERTRGRFVEHEITQGVNNLYEGITICTIHPAAGVKLLGQSHDGQFCVGCFERDSERVVLDAGFTKLYTTYFHRSAGLGRYLSNIAFWLARGSRGLEYHLLTPGRGDIATIRRGQTSPPYRFTVERPTGITYILQWEGKARLRLVLQPPDGVVTRHAEASSSPLRVTLTAKPGQWLAHVEGVDVGEARVPYVLSVALDRPPAVSRSAR